MTTTLQISMKNRAFEPAFLLVKLWCVNTGENLKEKLEFKNDACCRINFDNRKILISTLTFNATLSQRHSNMKWLNVKIHSSKSKQWKCATVGRLGLA